LLLSHKRDADLPPDWKNSKTPSALTLIFLVGCVLADQRARAYVIITLIKNVDLI
jgi:hypothetical protein